MPIKFILRFLLKESVHIGIDDTDSKGSMCTTYVAYKIIQTIYGEIDIIGYPRLVRLNPNIPWKTRGNGAVSISIGIGYGEKKAIGRIGDEKIFSYSRCKEKAIKNSLIDEILQIIERYRESSSNTGVVFVLRKPSEKYYYKAVREVADKPSNIDGIYYSWGNGRGLIGAYASVCWRGRKKTYECLTYLDRKFWNIERNDSLIDIEVIKNLEIKYKSLFDCYDYMNEYAVMIPRSKTPVLFGVRGLDPAECIYSTEELLSNSKLNVEGYILFSTNQATDDHISNKRISEIVQYDSVKLRGKVASDPVRIEGGHVIFKLRNRDGEIYCAAYEPTKEFRDTVSMLRPGDVVEVYGGVANYPYTVNLEKIRVLRIVEEISRNPLCRKCNVRMESAGRNKGYRCPRCGRRRKTREHEKLIREILPGEYDVPPIARRHLTLPFFLMDKKRKLKVI